MWAVGHSRGSCNSEKSSIPLTPALSACTQYMTPLYMAPFGKICASLLLRLHWRREERGPRLPHMFAHTESTQGLRVPYIVSPLEVGIGTVKVELRSGRRT